MSTTIDPTSAYGAINGTPTSTTATASASSKDEFMKLLVAQLQAQDPLNPQSGSDFVAQLAQITSVEQTAQTNDTLAAIQAGQTSASRAGLAGLVGRTVTAQASSITLAGSGAPPHLSVHLDGPAAKTQVIIKDASGNAVRTITLPPNPAGDVDLNWNGASDKGVQLPAGTYQVEVHATGADGSAVSASPRVRGIIDSVDFSNGGSNFRVGGNVLSPGDIVTLS